MIKLYGSVFIFQKNQFSHIEQFTGRAIIVSSDDEEPMSQDNAKMVVQKPTTSAQVKRKLAGADAAAETMSKKAKTSNNKTPDPVDRDRLTVPFKTGTGEFQQTTPNIQVVCPMPVNAGKKCFLMRRFFVDKCIKANEHGLFPVKWSPEIELSTSDELQKQKFLQVRFQLNMSGVGGVQEYINGEYPVKTRFALRLGVHKTGNRSMFSMDYRTFELLVSEGQKALRFAERNLRGRSFENLTDMQLPVPISISSENGTGIGTEHLLFIVTVFNWSIRSGKAQPFFTVRFYKEIAGGKLEWTCRGVTLNFREFHNLVFSSHHYIQTIQEKLAEVKIASDKMSFIFGGKIKQFLKESPTVNPDSVSFLLDEESSAVDSDNDDDDNDDIESGNNADVEGRLALELKNIGSGSGGNGGSESSDADEMSFDAELDFL